MICSLYIVFVLMAFHITGVGTRTAATGTRTMGTGRDGETTCGDGDRHNWDGWGWGDKLLSSCSSL